MLIAGLALLMVWLVVVAIVVGLCSTAAEGDRADRRRFGRRSASGRRASLRIAA
jgi:hypothetical protein